MMLCSVLIDNDGRRFAREICLKRRQLLQRGASNLKARWYEIVKILASLKLKPEEAAEDRAALLFLPVAVI